MIPRNRSEASSETPVAASEEAASVKPDAARQARLARALRENLKRRKAQARGRRDGAAPGGEDA